MTYSREYWHLNINLSNIVFFCNQIISSFYTDSQDVAKEKYLQVKYELLKVKNENLDLKMTLRKMSSELPRTNNQSFIFETSSESRKYEKVYIFSFFYWKIL